MTAMPCAPLKIADAVDAGAGPGHSDSRGPEAFAGVALADHRPYDALPGTIESKRVLRAVRGSDNLYTFGVAGAEWSWLDAAQPGNRVRVCVKGAFPWIDALSVTLKAATAEALAANRVGPEAARVTVVKTPHGRAFDAATCEGALAEQNPKWACMAHVEAGSGRVNDPAGCSAACEAHGVRGLVLAVSSLGDADVCIDDHPGVEGWVRCPQKSICCLPLTHAPCGFSDRYIAALKAQGACGVVHHPIMEARQRGILDGQDVEKGSYHRSHSACAVAAFGEALRLTLADGLATRAARYRHHEAALRAAVQAVGCEVTSGMPSLVVLNLPGDPKGREMAPLQACRAESFGIRSMLSAQVQLRIGILTLPSADAVSEIVTRFGARLRAMGGSHDAGAVQASQARHCLPEAAE